MSDESDDFGRLNPTTPNIPRKLPSGAFRPSENNNRAVPGPSRTNVGGASGKRNVRKKVKPELSDDEEIAEVVKKPLNSKPRRKKQQQAESEIEGRVEVSVIADEEVKAAYDDEDEDDEVQEIKPPKSQRLGSSRNPSSRMGNGGVGGSGGTSKGSNAKEKGKQKAKAPARKRRRQDDEDAMDVDIKDEDLDVEEVAEEEVVEAQKSIVQAGMSSRAGGRHSKDSQFQSSKIEARLQEELRQANDHIEQLKRQLEELLQVRHTEPERLMEQLEIRRNAQIQVLETLTKDLTTQMAKKDPLTRSNELFELLTREEADKEMQGLREQLKSYKDAVRERDKLLTEKERDVSGLKEDVLHLEVQLKAEIERGKNLALKTQNQKQPGSISRSRIAGTLPANQDPKVAQVIKFYEDLTNVIVPIMKVNEGRYLNTDDWVLNCCYTYKDITDPKYQDSKSLNFSLRLCYDLRSDAEEPVVDIHQLVESVHYVPLELDKESPEFVNSLKFLKETFTFERDQLSLFLRTLHDHISGEANDDNSKTAETGDDLSDDSGTES